MRTGVTGTGNGDGNGNGNKSGMEWDVMGSQRSGNREGGELDKWAANEALRPRRRHAKYVKHIQHQAKRKF